MNEYRPAAFSFAEAEKRIAEGRARIIAAEDGIAIHAGELENGGTPAVCAILAWRRCAAEHGRRLVISAAPRRLRKLIKVYQLEEVLPEIFSAEAEAN